MSSFTSSSADGLAAHLACSFGFDRAKCDEAVAAIVRLGGKPDQRNTITWLLDNGEEDRGGAVELVYCPHVGDRGAPALIAPAALRAGWCSAPCVACGATAEPWVSLHDGRARCGRYQNCCALAHHDATRAAAEAALTVGEATAAGLSQPTGDCLVLGAGDLSVWCYACNSYVEARAHPALGPLLRRAEGLKHGTADDDADALTAEAAADEGAATEVGAPLDAPAHESHGWLGEPSWAPPRLVAACSAAARPGYATRSADEFREDPATLRAKVQRLATLLRGARRAVAYTGAGLSTAAGISDYASKATGSIGRAAPAAVTSPLAATPACAHFALVALQRAGMLGGGWVQQNHDGLPQKAGLPQHALNEIHGSWYDPTNPVVPMDGSLRADLLADVLDKEASCDLSLALGTSLAGMNADRLVTSLGARAPRPRDDAGRASVLEALASGKGEDCGGAIGAVIVALQRTRCDSVAALRIYAPLDQVCEMLCAELGLALPEAAATTATTAATTTIAHEDLSVGAAAVRESAEATVGATLPPPEAGGDDAEYDVFAIPFDPADGAYRAGAATNLDLRAGAVVQLTPALQPEWDAARSGTLAESAGRDAQGHFAIRMQRTGELRRLGRWWLAAATASDAAGAAALGTFPVFNTSAQAASL